MTIRFIGPLLCGGLLALALTTGARAEGRKGNQAANLTIQQSLVGVNKKASKSNTSDRAGGGGGSGQSPAGLQIKNIPTGPGDDRRVGASSSKR
jgi:hypothetical protein